MKEYQKIKNYKKSIKNNILRNGSLRGSHENKNKYRFRENGNNNQFIENGEHRNKNSHNKGQQYTHDGIFKNKFRIHRYQKLKECIQKHQKKSNNNGATD